MRDRRLIRYTRRMLSPVRVVEAAPTSLAVLRGQASLADLSAVIRHLFDRFYQSPPAVKRGLNVVYYHGDPRAGTTIDVGVQAP